MRDVFGSSIFGTDMDGMILQKHAQIIKRSTELIDQARMTVAQAAESIERAQKAREAARRRLLQLRNGQTRVSTEELGPH